MVEISAREVAWAHARDPIVALRVRVLASLDQSGFFEEVPVSDALDEDRNTRHFIAVEEERVVAAVRVSRSEVRDWFMPNEIEGLGLSALSRLEVAPDRPVEPVMAALLREAYRRARAVGCLAWAVVVPDYEVERWQHLGFVPARIQVRSRYQGLVADLCDVAYLKDVGSPLAVVAQRYMNTLDHSARFDSLRWRPSEDTQLPEEDAPVWVLSDEALDEPRLLEDVDRPLLKAILGRSLMRDLAAGETLALRDDALVEVVEGEVAVEAGPLNPVLRLGRHEVVGVDQGAPGSRPISLRALRSSQILCLEPEDLQALVREAPDLALSIYRNACTGLRRSLRAAAERLRAPANDEGPPSRRTPRRRAGTPRILARTA